MRACCIYRRLLQRTRRRRIYFWLDYQTTKQKVKVKVEAKPQVKATRKSSPRAGSRTDMLVLYVPLSTPSWSIRSSPSSSTINDQRHPDQPRTVSQAPIPARLGDPLAQRTVHSTATMPFFSPKHIHHETSLGFFQLIKVYSWLTQGKFFPRFYR